MKLALAALAVTMLAGCGVPASIQQRKDCDAAKAAFRTTLKHSTDEDRTISPGNESRTLTIASHIVVNNPKCFDPGVVAEAQEYLDHPPNSTPTPWTFR